MEIVYLEKQYFFFPNSLDLVILFCQLQVTEKKRDLKSELAQLYYAFSKIFYFFNSEPQILLSYLTKYGCCDDSENIPSFLSFCYLNLFYPVLLYSFVSGEILGKWSATKRIWIFIENYSMMGTLLGSAHDHQNISCNLNTD